MRKTYRTFKKRFDNLGNPICAVPTCSSICQKFKNGNWRKFCDLHDSYSLLRETDWGFFKTRILFRDNHTCQKCGSHKELEVDHKVAIMNGGDMWDENNLWVLCNKCHKEKTKEDRKQREDGNTPTT